MGAMVVPNAVLVRLIWAQGGTPYAVNVIGGRKSGATTINQAFANTLGAAIKSGFTSSGFASRVHSGVSLASVGTRDVATANQAEFIDSGAAVAGTDGTTQLLPTQIALCVTLRTALAGRSYRGRVYLPGFTEAANTGAGCDAAAGVDATDFITAIQSAMTASGLTLAVLSRPVYTVGAGGVETLTRPGVATDVTSIVLRDTVWDTIRKRATPGI